MPTNIDNFTVRLARLAKKLPAEGVELVHKKLALDLLTGVVQWSPVDTGRFRGNWQVTQVQPTSAVLEQADPIGQKTLAVGSAEIAKSKPFSVTWIQNNLPYAVRLTEGHSQQSPAGTFDVVLDGVAPPA